MRDESGGRRLSQGSARLLGSACAGVGEIALFHPIDTTAKRLMSHQTRIVRDSIGATLSNVRHVVFEQHMARAGMGFARSYLSLYSGLQWAASYKICQRVYKFAGQPLVKDLIHHRYGPTLRAQLGRDGVSVPVMHGLAGALVGVGEISLLPLDLIKIKIQTDPKSAVSENKDLWRVMRERGVGTFYRGWQWAASRNAVGSFFLFGGASYVKENWFNLQGRQPTLGEHFQACAVGSFVCLVFGSPLDVIKTRIQNKPWKEHLPGMSIVRKLIRTEGLPGFYRGMTPKLLTVGPKLVFSFTAAQYLIQIFENGF